MIEKIKVENKGKGKPKFGQVLHPDNEKKLSIKGIIYYKIKRGKGG